MKRQYKNGWLKLMRLKTEAKMLTQIVFQQCLKIGFAKDLAKFTLHNNKKIPKTFDHAVNYDHN